MMAKYKVNDEDHLALIGSSKIKDRFRIIEIGLCASLSAIMYGYGLKEITSIPINTIVRNYEFKMNATLLQGLLIAIMPFGGLFGSLIAKALLQKITRLSGLHATTPILILSILLAQISSPFTLFIGRFLQGSCIGYYVSIAPIYLKQISPKQLRSVTGTFFRLGKIIGVLLVIILQLILGQGGWRILLSFTVILALTQSIILSFIGTDTPYEWIARNEIEKARESIQQLYKEEYVQSVLQEMMTDYQLESQPDQNQNDNLSYNQKSRAFWVAIHVCIVRNFSGGNSLIILAGIIMQQFDVKLAKWTPLIINSTQLIALVAYILVFTQRFGKRFLIVTSSGLLALLNLMLVIGLLLKNELVILLSIILFMIVYGGMLLSAVWSYPSQIIPPKQSLLPNIVHWIALSASTLAPSLVMSIMPNKQVYPCFLFFFLYTGLTYIYLNKYLVESNGLSYKQIIAKFQQ